MRLPVLVVVSALLHVIAAAGLRRPLAELERRHETIELELAPPRRVRPGEPVPPPAVVAPSPLPAPAKARTPEPRRVGAAPRVHVVAAAPGDASEVAVVAPEDPLDFTSAAPLAAPAAAAPAATVAHGPARPARPVPLASLSRPPSPPPLDDTLRAHYPAAARAAGRAGRAAVRVRIDADGVASVLAVLDASEPAFADACRATVQHSRWRAPLDAQGAAVATELTYTCAFEVGAW